MNNDVTIILANHNNVEGSAVARAMNEILGIDIDDAIQFMAEAHNDGSAHVTALSDTDAEEALVQLNEISGAQCWYMDDVPSMHNPNSPVHHRDETWASNNQSLYKEMYDAAQNY